MRKGVAIGYVIALILGVAVVALIGIWFVTSGGKFAKASLEGDCRIAMAKECTKGISSGSASVAITFPSTECTSLGFKSPMSLAECKSALGIG